MHFSEYSFVAFWRTRDADCPRARALTEKLFCLLLVFVLVLKAGHLNARSPALDVFI